MKNLFKGTVSVISSEIFMQRLLGAIFNVLSDQVLKKISIFITVKTDYF